MCVGVTLGSDDLINIPACKANLLHSEGCSYDGATHEGDIGEWAGGVETHPSARHAQTHSNEDYMHADACEYCTRMQILRPRKSVDIDTKTHVCRHDQTPVAQMPAAGVAAWWRLKGQTVLSNLTPDIADFLLWRQRKTQHCFFFLTFIFPGNVFSNFLIHMQQFDPWCDWGSELKQFVTFPNSFSY